MNSSCRWRCMQRPITVPSSTLRAANSVVVPVLPHPGMLPSEPGIASPECSLGRISLSILAGAQNPLSCSIGKPAFPSRPGAAGAAARNGGDWEERSHPEPRAARPFARAWRGWGAPDLPRSEHRGTLRHQSEDQAVAASTWKRYVTKPGPYKPGQVFEESGACPGVFPAASAPNTILCAISRRHSFSRRCSVRNCPSGKMPGCSS